MTLREDLSNFSKIRREECNQSTLQAIAYICKRNLWFVIVLLIVIIIIVLLIIKSTGNSLNNEKNEAPSPSSSSPTSISRIDVEPIE